MDLLAEGLAVLQAMRVPAGECPDLVQRELLVLLVPDQVEVGTDQIAAILECRLGWRDTREQVGRLSEDPWVQHRATPDHHRVTTGLSQHLNGIMRRGDISI